MLPNGVTFLYKTSNSAIISRNIVYNCDKDFKIEKNINAYYTLQTIWSTTVVRNLVFYDNRANSPTLADFLGTIYIYIYILYIYIYILGLASIGWSSLSYPQGQMNQEFDYSYPGTVAGPLIPNSLGPNIADLNGQKSSSAEYAVISNNAPIYLGRSHSFLVILKLDTPPPYNTWLTILNIFPLNNQVTE